MSKDCLVPLRCTYLEMKEIYRQLYYNLSTSNTVKPTTHNNTSQMLAPGTFLQLDSITCCILVILYLLCMHRRRPWTGKLAECVLRAMRRGIPGPTSLPLLGTSWTLWLWGTGLNRLHEFYADLYARYGPVVREEVLFNVPVVSVFERADIEKVLRSSGRYPVRPPTAAISKYRLDRPDRYASTGIVNEQGEKWQYLRTSLTTELTSPRTISGLLDQIEAIADDWCHLLRQQRNQNGVIAGLEYTAGRLGLEATCALVLGRRMGFLIPGQETKTSTELADAVHNHFIACRDTYFGLPWWAIFPTPAYKRLCRSEETIYKIALDLIKYADDSTKESAVFQSVLSSHLDEKEKTAAIVDFIAAGIHTLCNSLIFLLYQVAKHPRVQEKILEDPSNAYLKACISETFRISPTVTCLARVTEQTLNLSGHTVQPGTILLCQHGVACKSEKNFKNACEFRPERWLGEEKLETVKNATYLVIPFGYGRRLCPGKRFIEQALPVILEKTLKNFILQVDKPLQTQFEFLLTPKGPVSMSFIDRF